MNDIFEEIRRQQERLNEFLGPSRRIHEGILRAYAPIRAVEDSLRLVTNDLVSKGVDTDLLRSMAHFGHQELADYASVAAFSALERSSLAVADAIKQQTRWIEEAARLSGEVNARLTQSGALVAIEKLAASQSTLLDPQYWQSERPISSALTDILYAGRSAWALSFSGVDVDAEVLRRVARATEAVIEAFAVESSDEFIAVPPEAASAGARSVALILTDRVSGGGKTGDVTAAVKVEEVETFGAVKTITSVIRYVETQAAKPLLGGFGGWAMAAGLEIIDPGRPAEDRFDSAVKLLHDVFVDGVRRADATLSGALPSFFNKSVYDLRNKSTAHAVEAASSIERIATNLRERRRAFEILCGKVPATEEEWAEALRILLRKAAEAAVEFRDAIARGELSPRVPRAHA